MARLKNRGRAMSILNLRLRGPAAGEGMSDGRDNHHEAGNSIPGSGTGNASSAKWSNQWSASDILTQLILFFDRAADLAQMLAKSLLRICRSLFEIVLELQLLEKGPANFDSVSLRPFGGPNFA